MPQSIPFDPFARCCSKSPTPAPQMASVPEDRVTGKSVEYMTPSNYEIRDFKVEVGAAHPTVWIPAYRPPSKLVKVQVR